MQINPYLMFDGECEEAFGFYARVLRGKIEAMLPHEGSPAESQVPPAWRKKILHARLCVGDQVLMASDAPPDRSPGAPHGFCVSITVAKPEEAERIFHALAEGGKVQMPIAETFFSPRFGMLQDRYGIPWMIHCAPAA